LKRVGIVGKAKAWRSSAVAEGAWRDVAQPQQRWFENSGIKTLAKMAGASAAKRVMLSRRHAIRRL